MDELIDLIKQEGNFHPSEEVIRKLLSLGKEVYFPAKKPVIEYDRINTNVYVVKSGILRVVYYEEEREVTYGFTSPGTIFLSPRCYYLNQPAVMQFETCKKGCTCIEIPKARFDELLVESHECARWMFNLAMGQFCTTEKKLKYIKGDAKERIIAVLKYRPEILEVVSARVFASYIGVTESYLCRIKKEIL